MEVVLIGCGFAGLGRVAGGGGLNHLNRGERMAGTYIDDPATYVAAFDPYMRDSQILLGNICAQYGCNSGL
jgi:hypothetical protein